MALDAFESDMLSVVSEFILHTTPVAMPWDKLKRQEKSLSVNKVSDCFERQYLLERVRDVTSHPINSPGYMRELIRRGLITQPIQTTRVINGQRKSIVVHHLKHNQLVEEQVRLETEEAK